MKKWFIALAIIVAALSWLFSPDGKHMRENLLESRDSQTRMVDDGW